MMMTRIQYWKTPLSAEKAASSAANCSSFDRAQIHDVQGVDRSADNQRLRGRKQIFQNQRAEPEYQAAAVLHHVWPEHLKRTLHSNSHPVGDCFRVFVKHASSALLDCATMSRD